MIAIDRRGDVGIEMERGGTGRPVPRALLAADRPPGKGRTLQTEFGRPVLGQLQRRVPPAQGVGGCIRHGHRQSREHESLGVPERVTVVPRAGQPLRRNAPPLGPRTRLQDMEQGEPDSLLEFRIALDLHVGGVPEVVQVGPLLLDQPFPAGELRRRERRRDLVGDRCVRPQTRPAVGDELHHPQGLPRLQLADDRVPSPVLPYVDVLFDPGRTLDLVRHSRGHQQPARPGPVREDDFLGIGVLRDGLQRVLQYCGDARVLGELGLSLVGYELGLHDQPDRFVDRLHDVLDGRDRALGQ